ncbi:TetR/AcrR family transcriptional regulator [Aureimonas mangrovi]|uniref:TetR/AcrR family transcriptional regulator n=1 Tax=Aureimonas mangrovi TaxID=2758041 RepID=UPI00163D8FDA|nr:TetR/AcrR family transcriptional regulator [Aureimonas mangrovi]
MNTPKRRRSIGARPNPEAANAILDAAASLLERKGLRGLTTDAIAREARASKTTLYRWWPNRGALLLALYVRAKGDSATIDTGSLVEDVARTYARVFEAWRERGRLFSLIIAEAQHDDGVAQALTVFREERVREWLPTLRRSRERGELAENADLDAIAESIVAHAWFYLLSKRLDVDANILAKKVVGAWMRNKDIET